MLKRETRTNANRPKATWPVPRPVVALALVGALLCATALLFARLAHWAGGHPLTATLLALLTIPLLYTLFRAIPRASELRQATHAGMARIDRELIETAPAGAVSAPPLVTRVQEPIDFAPATAQERLAVVLPESAPDFAALDPDTFEAAVAALCERDGCREVTVVGGAGDLGADVLANAPDGRRVVVQCKQYGPTHKVGSQDLQRFGGTCWSIHGAQLAIVVTTSQFTTPAEEYAAECGIRCVDGAALTAWAEGSGAAPWGPATVNGS